MNHTIVRLVVVTTSLALTGCGGSYDQEACERAAEAQVFAEQSFGDLVEEHSAAHAEDRSHDDLADLIAGARLEVVLAEHNTRRHC